MFYFALFFVSFILAAILVPLVKNLASRNKIFDIPEERKIHSRPVPLLGGLAVFGAFVVATLIFWSLGFIEDIKISNLNILAIILAGFILIVGGILDDKYNLRPSQQVFFPILAALIAVSSGIKIQFVTNPLGGVMEFPVIFGTVLAFLWITGMIYTTKFLDGLDGLLSGVTVIGSIIIFIVSLFWDVPLSGTSILALILAGSAAGFLLFNWHPAKIFLGEGGSTFCGFMLGVLAIISGSKIATALLVMGVPILDVLWVIVRRIWQRSSPARADRKHLHFRLLDLGLTHRQTVFILYFITSVFGFASLFLHSAGKVLALGGLTVFMVIFALTIVILVNNKNYGKK